jgi:hypothetical protein
MRGAFGLFRAIGKAPNAAPCLSSKGDAIGEGMDMSAPACETTNHTGHTNEQVFIRVTGVIHGFVNEKADLLLILLAFGHAALVLSFSYAPVIALGLWWNSNTVAHYFLHRPFFRLRALNVVFSMFLSVLVGIPQTLWGERHLAHHAGKDWRFRLTPPLVAETLLILGLWSYLLAQHPLFFLTTYLPAYIAGLFLCWLHGYYEHARGTTSHYGKIYNFLFLNDGYHIEHHAHPGEHWTKLPYWASPGASASRWPAILRWLESKNRLRTVSAVAARSPDRAVDWAEGLRCNAVGLVELNVQKTVPQHEAVSPTQPFLKKRWSTWLLETLEHLVLRSPSLQRFVLTRHESAFRRLLPRLTRIGQVAIVGGGLFPRTLIVLERLLPQARFIVIDQSAANLQEAQKWVHGDAKFVRQTYTPGLVEGMDLVVIPLSFVGDRDAIYRQPPAPAVVIHDWLWRRRGISTVVSFVLLKRLNLVLS